MICSGVGTQSWFGLGRAAPQNCSKTQDGLLVRAESRGAFPSKQSDTKKYACAGSHRQTRSVRANQFATQIGETNTTYAQSRSLSGAVLRRAYFFCDLGLICSGLPLRLILKLRTDCQLWLSRGGIPSQQSAIANYGIICNVWNKTQSKKQRPGFLIYTVHPVARPHIMTSSLMCINAVIAAAKSGWTKQ